MKALKEIGIRKAVMFVFYTVISEACHVCIFPQIRVFIMRLFGATIGSESIIGNVDLVNAYHYGFSRIRMGKRCFIGDGALLDCRGGIVMEDDVTVSFRTNIITHINVGYHDHPLQKYYPTGESEVRMKKGCYIGTNATILPGVTIGEQSVVAAGAVVVKNVEAGIVAAGVPAKRLKKVGVS